MNESVRDIDRLRLPDPPRVVPRCGVPRVVRGEKFLKGPIPLWWVQRAARLPGKCIHVGLLLWWRVGLEKSRTIVFSNRCRDEFGIARHAGIRALKKLAEAGLVCVERHVGRSPRVTILTVSGAPDAMALSSHPGNSVNPFDHQAVNGHEECP